MYVRGNLTKIFKNEEFGNVCVIERGGNFLFCGSDVARALGYKDPHKAVSRYCLYGGECYVKVQTPSKTDETLADEIVKAICIPESDVYRLIAHSKLPSPERFERWLFDEILPTVRKRVGNVVDDQLFVDTYLPFADNTTKSCLIQILGDIRHRNDVIANLKKEIVRRDRIIDNLSRHADYCDIYDFLVSNMSEEA